MGTDYSYSQSVSEPSPASVEAREKKRTSILPKPPAQVESAYMKASEKYKEITGQIKERQAERQKERLNTIKERVASMQGQSEVNKAESELIGMERANRQHKALVRENRREKIREIFRPVNEAASFLRGGAQFVQSRRGGRGGYRGTPPQERPIFQGSNNAMNILNQGTAGGNASRLLMGSGRSNASNLLFGNNKSNASRLLFEGNRSNASRFLMGERRGREEKQSTFSLLSGVRDRKKKSRGITIHIRR